MRVQPRGFTLIELLVVMAILSLLAAALIPYLIGAQLAAAKTYDRLSLRFHYAALLDYEKRYGHLPVESGHEFVLAPWVKGVVEHTETNRDRYFSAALTDDPRRIALQNESIDEIWRALESTSSEDTHYAGRSKESRRRMRSGREIWLATDNEGGNVYSDGCVLALYGDGTVREIYRDPQMLKYGAPTEHVEGYEIDVGPDSPHPDLRKLRR